MDKIIRPNDEIKRLKESQARILQLIALTKNLIKIESERRVPDERRIIALENSINHFKDLKAKDEAKLNALVEFSTGTQMVY